MKTINKCTLLHFLYNKLYIERAKKEKLLFFIFKREVAGVILSLSNLNFYKFPGNLQNFLINAIEREICGNMNPWLDFFQLFSTSNISYRIGHNKHFHKDVPMNFRLFIDDFCRIPLGDVFDKYLENLAQFSGFPNIYHACKMLNPSTFPSPLPIQLLERIPLPCAKSHLFAMITTISSQQIQ